MRLPTVLGTRLEDFATLSYNLPMLLLELNSLSANEITWTSLNSYCSMNFIHILVVICVAQYTWFVCLSTRSEGRTWYTTHRGRLWIAATVKKPDPEEIRENEEFYRRLYGGRGHIMCTFTSPQLLELLELLHPPRELEMGMRLLKGLWWLYSSDITTHSKLS